MDGPGPSSNVSATHLATEQSTRAVVADAVGADAVGAAGVGRSGVAEGLVAGAAGWTA